MAAPARRAGVRPADRGPPGGRRSAPLVGYSVVSIAFGLWAWLLFSLAVPNTIRCVLLYWLTDYLIADHGHIGPGTWGGPTVAGAWAVHGGIALLLLPVWLYLFRSLTYLQGRLADRLLGVSRKTWPVVVALLVVVAGVAFGYAFTHQT